MYHLNIEHVWVEPFQIGMKRNHGRTTRSSLYMFYLLFVLGYLIVVCGASDCREDTNCSWPVDNPNCCGFLPPTKLYDGAASAAKAAVEGGFTQMVHIYNRLDPNIIWRGMVLIDPGNTGPNLVTEEAMHHVCETPTGPGETIRVYDGEEKIIGGEVSLLFSGPGPTTRYYRAKFRHVPHIIEGIDMVLNHDFYLAVFPEKVPGMLMIKSVESKSKETPDQKQKREEAERRGNEEARQQESQQREERRAAKEARQGSSNSNAHSGVSGGSSH